MPVSPSDFLTFAEEVTGGSTEIHYRNAVSRAYYACLHHGKAVADAKLKNAHLVFGKGSHEQVIGQLQDGKTHAWKSAAYILRDLKTRRVEADYLINEAIITHQDGLQAVLTARRWMQQIDAAAAAAS